MREAHSSPPEGFSFIMKRVLGNKSFRYLFLLSLFLVCSQAASATTVIIPTDDNMVIESRAIVRGRVLSIESAIDSRSDRIFTYITIRVQEVLKGEISEHKNVPKQEGGQVGERGTRT